MILIIEIKNLDSKVACECMETGNKGDVWLNSGAWLAIYMPLFILFFVILPQQRKMQRSITLKIKKKKGLIIMANEVIKKYIGKNCKISTGPYGTNIVGKIIEINENWIEVETKKGIQLINAEFVQSVKIYPSNQIENRMSQEP